MGVRRINLLPAEERAKVKRERGLVWALLALIVVVGALGGLYVFENQRVSNKRSELAGLQSRLAQLQQQTAALKPYETQQTQRASMTDVAKQIYDSRVIWSSIAEEISLLIPEECRLTQLTATVPAPMLAGSAFGVAGATGEGGADLQLSGEAYSHRDVAELMTRLGLMPQIKDITLVSADKTSAAGGETGETGETTAQSVVTFQIVASLRPFQSPAPFALPATPSAASGGETAPVEATEPTGSEAQ
ncbi:MAG: PilN domain-containing protein [Actinobacteria bacterium]|nr:PilN domain-containing protein [Actinomycetota bacterium]